MTDIKPKLKKPKLKSEVVTEEPFRRIQNCKFNRRHFLQKMKLCGFEHREGTDTWTSPWDNDQWKSETMLFGKYRGKTLNEVYADQKYMAWLDENCARKLTEKMPASFWFMMEVIYPFADHF